VIYEPIPVGSPEWITAVQEFHATHGQWPWEAYSEGSWAVAIADGVPYVGWTLSGAQDLIDRANKGIADAIADNNPKESE